LDPLERQAVPRVVSGAVDDDEEEEGGDELDVVVASLIDAVS